MTDTPPDKPAPPPTKGGGWVRRSLIGLAVMLTLMAGAAGIGWSALQDALNDPGPAAADTVLRIPPGAGVQRIGALLEAAGVVADGRLVAVAARLDGTATRLRAGEFRFPANVSVRGALDVLVRGQAVQYRLTVPEGLTSRQVVALVAADPILTGPVPAEPAEGSLLPETYTFERGTTRAAMLDRMAAAMTDLLADGWARRDPDLPLSDPAEVVILASIVEKETGVGDERPVVAGVFVNRLNRGMRLQSDPTVVYGVVGGQGPLGRAIRRSDLDALTPYNTYRIDGLPPTPIANPGRDSIEAVLNPARTPYLFFVADGTGGHAFAETYAEHRRNVAAWRALQRRSGN